jgi:hypothetical protein
MLPERKPEKDSKAGRFWISAIEGSVMPTQVPGLRYARTIENTGSTLQLWDASQLRHRDFTMVIAATPAASYAHVANVSIFFARSPFATKIIESGFPSDRILLHLALSMTRLHGLAARTRPSR